MLGEWLVKKVQDAQRAQGVLLKSPWANSTGFCAKMPWLSSTAATQNFCLLIVIQAAAQQIDIQEEDLNKDVAIQFQSEDW